MHSNTGYAIQLKTEFESVTGGVWPLNVGQVYTTLDRLDCDGMVKMELGDDDQKRYSITVKGLGELGSWWEAVPTDDPPPRDELMLKILMAIEHGPDHALGVLTRQRSALTSLLQLRRRERSVSAPGDAPDVGEALAALLVTANPTSTAVHHHDVLATLTRAVESAIDAGVSPAEIIRQVEQRVTRHNRAASSPSDANVQTDRPEPSASPLSITAASPRRCALKSC